MAEPRRPALPEPRPRACARAGKPRTRRWPSHSAHQRRSPPTRRRTRRPSYHATPRSTRARRRRAVTWAAVRPVLVPAPSLPSRRAFRSCRARAPASAPRPSRRSRCAWTAPWHSPGIVPRTRRSPLGSTSHVGAHRGERPPRRGSNPVPPRPPTRFATRGFGRWSHDAPQPPARRPPPYRSPAKSGTMWYSPAVLSAKIECHSNTNPSPKPAYLQAIRRMEPTGIEPVTSCLQSRRSPS